MTKYTNIIEGLEAATGPDRELDASIHLLFHPELGISPYKEMHTGHWLRMDGRPDRVVASKYTSSIDACLALIERVLPGSAMEMVLLTNDGNGQSVASAHLKTSMFAHPFSAEFMDTLPIALLLALFHALEAKEAV